MTAPDDPKDEALKRLDDRLDALAASQSRKRVSFEAGLPEAVSSELSRATVIGAAHLMDVTGEAAMDLRLQVTSPGGTTSAALSVLLGDPGLNELMVRAVAAGVARAKDLG